MCDFITPMIAALGAGGGAAATAGGATALASGLQTAGLVLSVAGPIIQGVQANRAAQENARFIEEQKQQEAVLASTRVDRERQRFRGMIAQQRAELLERGVSLDSPTAVFLGESAAREMSFNTQSIRSGAQANYRELSAEQRMFRSRGRQALFSGGLSAAGALLNREPDEWAELLS